MALSPDDLQLLSRLIDQALALPVADRQAWLEALMSPEDSLRPHLQRALANADDALQPGAALQLPQLTEPFASALGPGQRCGPYELLEELGRGGMGQVWLAHRFDGLYDREVALKLPRVAGNRALADRMAQERLIGARLEHPRIARLYDAGVDPVLGPYIVMERVRGQHLLEHAHSQALTRPQCMRLMLQVCDAVAHAHRHLVVHRDLKPSNVMVDERGEVKLLDFGVARLLDDEGAGPSTTLSDSGLTRTPRYAAPEQVQGGVITTATDVYALGAVLSELLEATPGPLEPELQAVLARAMASDPQQRYGSAEPLADDLRAVLAHRSPIAGPLPRKRHVQLWARRHRLGLTLTLVGFVLLTTGGGLLLMEQKRTLAQAERLQQVRLFMLTMFTDAEPRADQGMDSVTAVQMIEAARDRARTSFANDLVLRAEVLNEIAIMWRRFDRPGDAASLFQEAHALMQVHAPVSEPGRHTVAAQWAQESVAHVASGQPGSEAALARARPLAESALAGCQSTSTRCAKARAAAHVALRNLATLQGDGTAALRHAEAAVVATDQAFGTPHAESASARVQWAIVLRNEDRLQQAQTVLDAANTMVKTTPLRRGDEQERGQVQAMLQGDRGQYRAALETLAQLSAQTPDGAPSTALLQRLRAQSAFALGDLSEALAAAQRSQAAAKQRADSWEEFNALLVRTRSLAALQQHAEAQTSWESLRTLLGPLNDTDIRSIRLHRAQWEIALRAGQMSEARDKALYLVQPNLMLASISPLERALNLMAHTTQARHEGRWDEAQAILLQAERILVSFLEPEHPLRLRLVFEQALVEVLRGKSSNETVMQTAAHRLLATWPANSVWRTQVQAVLDSPRLGQTLIL
jgi:eukaryotic-like serine/threonine-protein kinase